MNVINYVVPWDREYIIIGGCLSIISKCNHKLQIVPIRTNLLFYYSKKSRTVVTSWNKRMRITNATTKTIAEEESLI